jgi:hypothetical protein
MLCSLYREGLGSENIVAMSVGRARLYHSKSETQGIPRESIGHKSGTIVELNYTLMITRLILKARKQGAITQVEADHLSAMLQDSLPAASTRALVSGSGVPDFLYAALNFSTMIWQLGDAAESDVEARAGYMLAQFVLSQERPRYDPFWSATLLRELYEAHAESAHHMVVDVA